jgi:lipopolysaccharide export LptBFGC system permease protein LptF
MTYLIFCLIGAVFTVLALSINEDITPKSGREWVKAVAGISLMYLLLPPLLLWLLFKIFDFYWEEWTDVCEDTKA